MPKTTIDFYFQELVESAKFFYSKNAVGKYKPESVGILGLKRVNCEMSFLWV